MIVYILKRLLLFTPTMLMVSMLAFGLSKLADGDITDTLLHLNGVDHSMNDYLEMYEEEYKRSHRNLPSFYFSLRPNYVTHNTNNIINPLERRHVESLIKQRHSSTYAIESYKTEEIKNDSLESKKHTFHYPTLKWNGLDNQYHHWLSSIISGDFGVSNLDGLPAITKIWHAMRWTLLMLGANIVLTLLFSFPYGVYTGLNIGGKFDAWTGYLLFIIYSMPTFWIATIAVMVFTTREYDMQIFPSVGLWYQSSETSFWTMISEKWSLFILPLIIIVLKDLAYLGRLVRETVATEASKSYVTTAKAKGLTKHQYALKHILPNSLTPAITLIVGALPSAFTGILLMEVIFNIPGMGRLMYTSISYADWNIVFIILLLTAFVTAASYLIGDLLITWFNPKINQ